MNAYVLDVFDNGDYIYFKVAVKTEPLPEDRLFKGRDLKFRFLRGNKSLFVSRINKIKEQVFNGYFWGFKNMYFNGAPCESVSEDKGIIGNCLSNKGKIKAIYESIVPDVYFPSKCKNKYKIIKKMNEEYRCSYLLRKEVMVAF